MSVELFAIVGAPLMLLLTGLIVFWIGVSSNRRERERARRA